MRFEETATCKILIDHRSHLHSGFIINVFIHIERDGRVAFPVIQFLLVESNMLNVARQLLHVK